jgi:CheY-like chemotaxis protein
VRDGFGGNGVYNRDIKKEQDMKLGVTVDVRADTANMDYQEFLDTIRRNTDPNSNTVLIVDDEKAIRMRVARDVKRFDPTIVIVEAGNGKEGLEKLQQIRAKYYKGPLFIVLDLNMPIMDGWEFIETLRKEYESQGKEAGIPIVVLSSTSGEKGGFLRKKSVHDGKAGYSPLVTVAKEACADASRYDAKGEQGLAAWFKYFVRKG